MKYARDLGPALIALAFLTGCDSTGRTVTPTQPSQPSTVETTTPTVTGEIIITSISPEPGTTVPVRACAPGTTMICADEPKLTVEVVIDGIDEHIPNAVLSVRFDECGYWGTAVPSTIAAGSRLSLTTSVISLSDHEGPAGAPAPAHCELPAVTSGIVVSLWRSGQPRMPPLLTQTFTKGYTFAMP
jgi:hypothetical protein